MPITFYAYLLSATQLGCVRLHVNWDCNNNSVSLLSVNEYHMPIFVKSEKIMNHIIVFD